MHAQRRSYWFVLACVIWLASLPLINIYHDATVHPVGEAGHSAEFEEHVNHPYGSEHASAHVFELFCDGWHGYIDTPPLTINDLGSSKSLFNSVVILAHTEAARHGLRLSTRTRAPPFVLS